MKPSRIVVDSCIWISAFLPEDVRHFECLGFVDQISRGRHKIVMPYAQHTEFVCRFANLLRGKHADPATAQRAGEELLSLINIEWLTVDRDYATKAARLGLRFNLRGMDALIAYAATSQHCELRTNDRDFLNSGLSARIQIKPV